MKIGIVGGTFDPVHLAHLEMGRVAKEQKGLEQIWFMPSKIPPHKKNKNISDETVRFHLVELAIQGMEGFYASDFELKYPHTTYTADTMERLSKERRGDEFYFILGGDSLFYFEKWYHPETILKYATVLAVGRAGIKDRDMEYHAKKLMCEFGGRIELLSMPEMQISSSMIREKMAAGEDVKRFLPEKVYRYLFPEQ